MLASSNYGNGVWNDTGSNGLTIYSLHKRQKQISQKRIFKECLKILSIIFYVSLSLFSNACSAFREMDTSNDYDVVHVYNAVPHENGASHRGIMHTGTDGEMLDESMEASSVDGEHYSTIGSPAESRKFVKKNCSSDTYIIDKLLNGTGYNKFRIPEESGVDVAVEFWLQAITSISEITNDFEMDIYINEMWMDPSLNFEHLSPCKHNLSLSHQVLERLWTPNSCFINSKIAQIHNSPFRFNYNNQEVRMRWNPYTDSPVYATGPILLPDFDLVKIHAYLVVEPYPAGMWDELHVKLSFERRYIWYFMQAYVPTFLTIFISWVSFSLGPKAIPARTMLGVNALLAMIFQFGNIMRNLPRVSYVKAIDVWMLGAMSFIFCSLLELAIVGHKVKEDCGVSSTARKRSPTLCKKRLMCEGSSDCGGQLSPKITSSGCGTPIPATGITYSAQVALERRFMLPSAASVPTDPCAWRQQLPQTGHNSTGGGGCLMHMCCALPRRLYAWFSRVSPDEIDKVSSIAFPTMFALFNIAYWSYYGRKAAIAAAFVHQ